MDDGFVKIRNEDEYSKPKKLYRIKVEKDA